MALEEYLESEVAVAIAATAIAAFTRGTARGAQQAATSAVQSDPDAPDQSAGGPQGEGSQP